MKDKIPCDIIQDLLPLYADGLTRENTGKEIEEHLKECALCRESYDRMKSSVEACVRGQKQEAEREIDYLKAVKKRNIRNMVLGAAAVFAVMAAALGAKLFIIGSPTESYGITYLDADGQEIRVGGAFFGSAAAYAGHRMKTEPDGSKKLVIYSCLASAWNRNGVFNLKLDMGQIREQVDVGGTTVKKDGTVISQLANELYEARNPYVGDGAADGKLAGALGIGRRIGAFTSELDTAYEPYGWTLNFQDSVRDSHVMEGDMKDLGCVLLALTDNLGEVAWTYTVETEKGPVGREGALTRQEASEYLGEEVKSFGESPERVQELLDLLSFVVNPKQ